MSFVYVVIENSDDMPEGGGIFPTTYATFEAAKGAAIAKYQDELDRQREEIGPNYPLASEVDVPESKTGFTTLYVEKGINLYIHKLPVKKSGGRRKTYRKQD
jgi:hypothetical protein